MRLSALALTIAILLSFLYAGLAFAAFTHVNKEKTTPLTPRWLAMTFWWPFYDIYDDSAQRLRLYGKIVLPIAIAAYVVWVMHFAYLA